MKKNSLSASTMSVPEELQVTVIKKVKEQYSQQITMKLQKKTTFGCIVEFMHEQGLLKTKNATVKPAQNESYVIGHERKISECYNLIKLKFIVEEEEGKEKKGKLGNVQALRNEKDIIKDEKQKSNICGKDECMIM